ncbi:MAG: DNA-binding response regulator [Puniceicoccaceae bacterium]|nr:MAG: DNA-binding response regulator [Puniceicoccaceae bacterium]
MKNCLIIEDLAECRRWLREIVAAAFQKCQVEEADNLKSALVLAEKMSFDLVLIDLALPDGFGLDALRHFGRCSPETICVIVTVMGQDPHIVAALSAGAQGYLLKEQPAELLSRQLADLSVGIPALSPSIARRIMKHFQRTGPSDLEPSLLTEREKQTLSLIARGLRNGEVAKQMGIAPSTVASHVKSIYRKLSISNRAEASWHATRLGL